MHIDHEFRSEPALVKARGRDHEDRGVACLLYGNGIVSEAGNA